MEKDGKNYNYAVTSCMADGQATVEAVSTPQLHQHVKSTIYGTKYCRSRGRAEERGEGVATTATSSDIMTGRHVSLEQYQHHRINNIVTATVMAANIVAASGRAKERERFGTTAVCSYIVADEQQRLFCVNITVAPSAHHTVPATVVVAVATVQQ